MAKKKPEPPKQITYKIFLDAKARTCEIEDCEAIVALNGKIDFEVVLSGHNGDERNLNVHFKLAKPRRQALLVGGFTRNDLNFNRGSWKTTAQAVSAGEYDIEVEAFIRRGPRIMGACKAEAKDKIDRARVRMIIVG